MAATICLILSVVFAALSATNVPEHPRFRFLSAAVLTLALSFLLGASRRCASVCSIESVWQRG